MQSHNETSYHGTQKKKQPLITCYKGKPTHLPYPWFLDTLLPEFFCPWTLKNWWFRKGMTPFNYGIFGGPWVKHRQQRLICFWYMIYVSSFLLGIHVVWNQPLNLVEAKGTQKTQQTSMSLGSPTWRSSTTRKHMRKSCETKKYVEKACKQKCWVSRWPDLTILGRFAKIPPNKDGLRKSSLIHLVVV